VQKYGFAIQYITNPSEAVQMAAVQKNGFAIQYITNPSEAVQMAAKNGKIKIRLEKMAKFRDNS
jgi:hypothetical protein